jgi:thioesterase domain-containing protein/acyl carrier protein
MLSVPRPEDRVRAMLPSSLDLAVINAPAISIVSGPTPEIEAFAKSLEGQGVSARRLQTSHGFHSRAMEEAARAFESFARRVAMKPPRIPIASNLSGDWMTDDQATDPAYWSRHLRHAVRFGDNLLRVAERFESAVMLEMGPGNTLCAIASQNAESVARLPAVPSIRHAGQKADDQAFFLRSLGALWCHGAPVDLDALHAGERRARLPLPGYPFERQRYWIDMARPAPEGPPKKGRGFGWFKAKSGDAADEAAPAPESSSSGDARKPLDEEMVRIWCKVLGTQSVGPDDNFFDLGGHSLMAVQIMVELEKVIGERLPLAALVEAPTIRQFVRLIESRKTSSGWSCLVPLHTAGSKPPFFLMHSHGGNILEYQLLANILKRDRPVYALQCRGLDGTPVGEADVEEMAAAYLKEIRAVQPKGPYHLGGYCFGGYLALEAAQRLLAEKEEVGLLVLINSGTWLFPRYPSGTTGLHRLLHALRYRAELELAELSGKSARQKTRRIASRARRISDLAQSRIEEWRARLPAGSTLALKGHSLTWQLEQLAGANDRAWARYRPKPYPGKTLFLRAKVQPYGIEPDPWLGWEGLLTGEVVVREVPGFRQNLLDEPNVRDLAGHILESL